MNWSKNQAAAKALLTDYYAVYPEAVKASQGYNQPILLNYRKKPMAIIGEDPKLELLQDFDKAARVVGHPGPPTPAAAEVEQNWIIPLMIGQAVQTENVDTAVDWATQKIEAIYARCSVRRPLPGRRQRAGTPALPCEGAGTRVRRLHACCTWATRPCRPMSNRVIAGPIRVQALFRRWQRFVQGGAKAGMRDWS